LQKYSEHVSNFMKFECVEKKKFGGQNPKKRQIVCRVPQAHVKPRLCRVPNGRTHQTLTVEGGR
jgi:hypothetical protein